MGGDTSRSNENWSLLAKIQSLLVKIQSQQLIFGDGDAITKNHASSNNLIEPKPKY